MNREQAYTVWLAPNSRWGAWAKPVLLSFMADPLRQQNSPVNLRLGAEFSSEVAIVVELPGSLAVLAGIELARSGYRPVPVFHASPFAFEYGSVERVPAVVDVVPILHAMEKYTEALGSMDIADSAPPAFLLDANRSAGPLFPPAGVFDNRSIVRESDLPAADAFKTAGIRRIVLVRDDAIRRDLEPILRSWQREGLAIQTQTYGQPWNPVHLQLKERSRISTLLYRFRTWLALTASRWVGLGRTDHPSPG